MRKVTRSALVPFQARDMFRLVDDVEAYPEFLPWCHSTEVRSRSDGTVEATLELRKGSVSKSFTTRNRRCEFTSMDLTLVDGPFKHLSGGWRFTDLGEGGSKVSLELEFEFESRLVDRMFGPFFEEICSSLVEAFSKRAAEVYG